MKDSRNSVKIETETIYETRYISNLFNSMSKTYGLVNYISSFGFTERWRHQCIAYLPETGQMLSGYDLMSGMGELWHSLNKRLSKKAKVIAIDLSEIMHREATKKKERYSFHIETLQADILQLTLVYKSADFIVSSFGLKTFNHEQLQNLAEVTCNLLRPGGTFSFVEISSPSSRWLRIPFHFYLKWLIPVIGRIFNGNSNDYRMLGIYCEKFQNAYGFTSMLREQGLAAEFKSLFFGCASVVYGCKPGSV
ncbi:MAG: class I SAM-dependent methyltransferase [Leptospiraceae bacterium]|nr:class I SAM-dependent methyltransferase [Leptospiraceae bacterium]